MFELDLAQSVLLVLCLIAACSFEFVNGFHDTANAVATVIYTNSLKPWAAVIWSGFCNFAGVFAGGIGIAVGIINLLPVETLVDQNIAHSMSMVMALLITAIFWNLLTWYFGIPCSSSHTLIGSILGVGIAYSLLPLASGEAVNWGKAQEMGLSLLISPLFGFSMAIILMFIIRSLTKKTDIGDSLFKEPKKNQPPPIWIRGILLVTCTLVSFFHGSNDGQKGVGLVMLILIGIVPAYFALDNSFTPTKLPESLVKIERVISTIDVSVLSAPDRANLAEAADLNRQLQTRFSTLQDVRSISKNDRFLVRKDIMIMDRYLNSITKKPEVKLSDAEKGILKDELKQVRK